MRGIYRIAIAAGFAMLRSMAGPPDIIAHRGASHDAPENTLAAFRLGFEQAADGVEGDFRLTLDGHIVACHDATTRRTTGRDLPVWNATLAELKALDAGAWKGPAWKDERIPALDEVFSIMPAGKTLYIEIYNPFTVAPLRRALAASRLDPAQVVVISFETDAVAAAKKHLPGSRAFWITSMKTDKVTGKAAPTLDKILATLRACGADGVDCQTHPDIDAALVNGVKQAGYSFHLWTVNDPADARRLTALGVDSLTTDKPRLIRDALESR